MIHGLKDLVWESQISRKSGDLNQHQPEKGRVSNVKIRVIDDQDDRSSGSPS